MEAPKVFISYSHDSPEHAGRVLALSDRLRQEGIDSHIDQYEVSPPEGWPRWMVNKVEWADFVLVVCTETYQQRFKGKAPSGQGKGVKWEGAILTQELYDAEAQNTRFIPVVFASNDTAHIPVILRGQTYYDVSADKGYEALYRHLTGQPAIAKPTLGKLKPMPQLNPSQDKESKMKKEAKAMLTILHLSDIHRTTDEPVSNKNILKALIGDLKRQQKNEGLPKPDILVISGDLTQSASEEEYEEAFNFIDALKNELTVPDLSRVVLVPGNHDVNRDICGTVFTRTGHSKPSGVDEALIVPVGQLYLWTDEKNFAQRFAPFSEFYRRIRNRSYSVERKEQYDIWIYPEFGIFFVGLNSCDRVDHIRFQGEIYEEALFNAENRLKDRNIKEIESYIKIAVWHHDLNWLGRPEQTDCLKPLILGQLVDAGYDLGLCGHTHRTEFNSYKYHEFSLPVIASGSLCAGPRQRQESIPRLYNLIRIEGKEVRVYTRFRQTKDTPWRAYANWGLPPQPYFNVPLKKAVSVRPEDLDKIQPETNFTAYLKYLRQETMHIDIRGLVTGKGKLHQFPIDELYIPLRTRYGVREDREMLKSVADDALLQEALKERRLFIKGDPGSGKTTFMRLIAYTLCQAKLGEVTKSRLSFAEPLPLPLLIRVDALSRYISQCVDKPNFPCPVDKDSPEWLMHYLDGNSKELNWGLSGEDFRKKLKAGRCMILLDGLDEAPSRQVRVHLSRLTANLVKAYPKCQVVLTSRPTALADGADAVPLDFHTVEIASLDDRGIEDFLTRWCSILYVGAPDKSERYKNELREALKHGQIRVMAKTPVMLTALAVVHWNENRLPEQRAELYESVLTWLFRSREEKEGRLIIPPKN
jgi:3',5'-cyclic AMP phosphodiesterase CpdA